MILLLIGIVSAMVVLYAMACKEMIDQADSCEQCNDQRPEGSKFENIRKGKSV